MKTQLCYLQVLTPLHVGIGAASTGIVDLPIAREKATGWPTVPASGVKGTLRANYNGDQKNLLFGAATKDNEPAKPGAIAFSDGRLLALPVRSYSGTFAYCTSSLVLQRLARDCMALEADNVFDVNVADGKFWVTSKSKLVSNKLVVLQDLDFIPATSDAVDRLATTLAERLFEDDEERNVFIERFAIVPNNAFDFLCESATEIKAHVTLEEDTKTAKDGGLRYEETLPAEAIFVLFQRGREEHLAALTCFDGKAVQFGGNASTGCGLCRIKMGGGK